MNYSMSYNSIYCLHLNYYSIYCSFSLINMILMFWFIIWFNWFIIDMILYILLWLLIMLFWINDILLESYYVFSFMELLLLINGISLFMFSELMLFFSCFWDLLNYSFNCFGYSLLIIFPLLIIYSFTYSYINIYILLFSSISIQLSLLFIKLGIMYFSMEGLGNIISYGLLFFIMQFIEFIYSYYSLSDIIIGSIFYFTVGLHGIHVIIGCYGFYLFNFMSLSWNPLFFLEYSLNLELNSYYWHFVDIIWLIVFILFIY